VMALMFWSMSNLRLLPSLRATRKNMSEGQCC
jgi:hypothetical protein